MEPLRNRAKRNQCTDPKLCDIIWNCVNMKERGVQRSRGGRLRRGAAAGAVELARPTALRSGKYSLLASRVWIIRSEQRAVPVRASRLPRPLVPGVTPAPVAAL